MQLGGHAHVVERLVFEAQMAAHGLGQPGHAAEMALEAGMALGQRAQEHVGALALGRRAAGVLVRVHALVGDEEGLAGDGRLLRDGDGAVGRGDREAVSALDERGGRQQLDLIAAIGVGQDAELVAAEAIRTPVALDTAVERLPEAREERVAGEMAEGVVVALEAVEVEEQEHGGVRGPAGRATLEVDHEPAPVGQAGQAVAGRGRLQLAPRGAQGDDRKRHEHQGDRQDRERRRSDVAEQAGSGVAGDGHEDPVVGVPVAGAQVAVGGDVSTDGRHAARAAELRRVGEAVVTGDAERRPDLLGPRAVDEHAAAAGVDQLDGVLVVVGAQLAAEALDGQLVVDDGHRAALRSERDRCGVADDPIVRVGRHVGL